MQMFKQFLLYYSAAELQNFIYSFIIYFMYIVLDFLNKIIIFTYES